MNLINNAVTEKIKRLWQNKTVRIVLVCALSLVLLLAIWLVFFHSPEGKSTTASYEATALEERMAQLLCKIEGVEDATVMVGEENGVPVSAVVIIKGDVGLLTRLRVTDATANALNIARQDVLVYPAD